MMQSTYNHQITLIFFGVVWFNLVQIRLIFSLFVWTKRWTWIKTKGKNAEVSPLNSFPEHIRGQLTACYRELKSNREAVTCKAIKDKFHGLDKDGETLMGLI